jgi:capsular exopolysaccharide synthesis family protein
LGRGKFIRSLKQRWWLLALIVLPITLGTMIWAMYSPTKYEGLMTIADRRDRDLNIPPIYADQLMGGAVNEQEIRVTNLANTITSLSVLRGAFEQLVSMGILKENTAAAEREFMGKVEVRPLRGSEFLTVSYVGDQTATTRTVIEVISDKFQARYRTLNSSAAENSVKYIEDQLREQKGLYEQKLQDQKEFMEQYPEAIAYDQNTAGLISLMNQTRERMNENERNLAAAVASLSVVRSLENSPLLKADYMSSVSKSPLYDEVERRLAGLRANLQALRETYGPKHPRILQVNEQIAEDEALLKRLKDTGQDTYASTQGRQLSGLEESRRNDLMTAQRAAAASSAAIRQSEGEMARLQEKFDRLPAVMKELASMNAGIAAQAVTVNNLESKLQEARIRAGQNEGRSVYFLDSPIVQQVDPGVLLKTAVAFFLSLIVAISLIASMGQFDQAAYTASDAENMLGFPVIAALPRSSQQRLNPDVEAPTPLAASYQILSTQIMSIKEKLAGPGILISAAEPMVGRSTVAANLAISLARDGARVLLIDADLRKPGLHSHFGLQNRAGLTEILSGTAGIEDVVQPTGVEGLLFVAAGQPPVNPVRLLGSTAMDQFVEQVSKGADFIVFDSPAGAAFGDAVVLAENVQNVVLVHEAGKSGSEAEVEFHKSLERLGINVVGMVLNKTRPTDCPGFQYYTKNYEPTITAYHPMGSRAALGPGDSTGTAKPQQYGNRAEDEEE